MHFLVFIGAYLLGSIPFPYLLAKLKTGRDIREMGSGNVGATNVMRTAGKTIGLITLILDVAKGATAVLLGRYLLEGTVWGAIAGFFAVLGHAYPVFLGFRGGKSVATGAGAFLILSPLGILCSIALFILVLAIVRIVSVSSILASGMFPVFAWLFSAEQEVVIWGAICASLIIFRHRPNIQRLIKGTEKRLGEPKNV
ncbi:glycerol-3-phosphate 1-O-acyltransferase PlsY [bacterium]|nr:glycerol-3-phosphate 1-O-acyltransferase PlsY [bacterium]MCI0604828.1 glycerol-3-phosphate 1-O-acyltransferase PlsY [bacterium]